MGELFGCVCVTLVFLLPVVAVAGWFLKVGGNALESRALRAWFGKHGTDFADGAVPKTHPLFAPIASKLSYEPEPPGHVELGTLWWAGSGTRDGKDFSFVAHSPSHPQYPNTWRLFMEGHTGLTGEEVLVMTANASEVFVDGALAKRTLEDEVTRSGWEWATVQSSGKGEEAEWLTPERGALVQGLLRPGRALHVYPGFVAVVLHGRGSVALIEDALVARDLLLDGPVTDEGPREVESEAANSVGGSEESLEQALRGKVDWTPAGGGHEWAEVTPHEDGLRWTLRAAPDNLFKWLAAGMWVLFVVIGVLNYLEGEEVSVVGAVVLFGFIGALNGLAWLDGRWDIGWMGVLDLEAMTLTIGRGQELASVEEPVVQDLSGAQAIQLVHGVRRTSSQQSGQATQTVRRLYAAIVLEDGTRIPLATFSGSQFWNATEKVVEVPEWITEILGASDWLLLDHL